MGGGIVLEIENLRLAIGGTPILKGVSLSLGKGARFGVVGESGSGKTMTALSVIGLLPEGASSTGSVRVDGEELLGRPEREMNRIRGRKVAMIFQDSLTSLDPLMRVERQMALPLRLRGLGRRAARAGVIELLRRVHFDHPEARARAYPHQLSGGQRQRVSLAMALAGEPDVLIADEPTTALDVTVKAAVAQLIKEEIGRTGTTLMLITHDFALVAYMCERTAVMYGGHVVEEGETQRLLHAPRHRYTAALLASMPALGQGRSRGEMRSIPGAVPAAGGFPSGCPFRTRCATASPACEVMPPFRNEGSHRFACWHPAERAG
jgi:peptide/nickel transport system ATP-binding protein